MLPSLTPWLPVSAWALVQHALLCVKEEAKVLKSAKICDRVGLAFSHFALSTFGEFGRQADQIFSTLVDLYAAKHDLRRSIAAYQLRQQVLVALMRSKRLLLAVTASGGLSGGAPSAIDQQSSWIVFHTNLFVHNSSFYLLFHIVVV